ncbi:DUF6622 family protein [Bordetella genomosp. 5]|uniref:DUF6622 family protein n=1 Tax=Bordetella genomosp. 5 TaxID=1395608 RepID=UPI0034E894B2
MPTEFLRHTPLWVWGVLLLLIYRGIRALSPRRSTLLQTLLLPSAFLVWGLASIHADAHVRLLAYAAFGIFVCVGGVAGYLIWPGRLGATYDSLSRRIARPGSPITLVSLIIIFVCKFVISAMAARNPSLTSDAIFTLASGGFTGLADGLLWGFTIRQLWPLRHEIWPRKGAPFGGSGQ